MLRLVARYADCWNWWISDHRSAIDTLRPIIEELERACGEVGRDPATLQRSLDLYSVDSLGKTDGRLPSLVTGTAEEISETLLGFAALGFGEVRCLLFSQTVEGIEAMKEVVDLVHAG
jgi:alkanesulfonate monooxygenase SsuD/methylene tetrahydromethanopterin reductase-like flavin-dependent oxidoreductase (luciferase family)